MITLANSYFAVYTLHQHQRRTFGKTIYYYYLQSDLKRKTLIPIIKTKISNHDYRTKTATIIKTE